MGFLNSWIVITVSFIDIFLSEVQAGTINCTKILQAADITRSGISCNFNDDNCGYTLTGQWVRTKSYSFQGNKINTGIDKSPFVAFNRNTTITSSRSVIRSPELQPGTYCLSFFIYSTNIFEALIVNSSTGHNVTHELRGKIQSGWQNYEASVDETSPFTIEFNFIQKPTIIFGKYETMGIDSILLVQTSGIGSNKTDVSCSPGGKVSANGTCDFDDDTCGYTIQGHFERKIGLFNFAGNVVNQGHGVNSSYIVCNWLKIGASNNNTLTSPVIKPGTYCLTFWYYFTGKKVGLSVFTSSGKALFANITDPETTHAWTQVSLSVTENKPFQVSFQMLRAKGFFNQLETIAIDDITLSSVPTAVCTEKVPEGSCSFSNSQPCGFSMDMDRWKIQKGSFSLFGRTITHSGQDDSFYALFEPFKNIPNTREGQTFDIMTSELLPGHYCLSFWYILPTHYSNMSVLTSTTTGDKQQIWTKAGTGKDWLEATLNITLTTNVKFVFRCLRISSHSTAFAGLDNIKLTKQPGFPTSTTNTTTTVNLSTFSSMKPATTKQTSIKSTTRRSSTLSTRYTPSTVLPTATKQTTTKSITSLPSTRTSMAKVSTIKPIITQSSYKSTDATKLSTLETSTSQTSFVKTTTFKSTTGRTASSKKTSITSTPSKATTVKPPTKIVKSTTIKPTKPRSTAVRSTSSKSTTAKSATSKETSAKARTTTSKLVTTKSSTFKSTPKSTASKTIMPKSTSVTVTSTTYKPKTTKTTRHIQTSVGTTALKSTTDKSITLNPTTAKRATSKKAPTKTTKLKSNTSEQTTSKLSTITTSSSKSTNTKLSPSHTTGRTTSIKRNTTRSTVLSSQPTTTKPSPQSFKSTASTENTRSSSTLSSSTLISTDKLTTKSSKGTPKAKHTKAPSTKTTYSSKQISKHTTQKPLKKTTMSPKIIKTTRTTQIQRNMTSYDRISTALQSLHTESTRPRSSFTTDTLFTGDLTKQHTDGTTEMYSSSGLLTTNYTTSSEPSSFRITTTPVITHKSITNSSLSHNTKQVTNKSITIRSSPISTGSIKTSTESGTIGSESHQNQRSGNGGAIAGGVVAGVVVIGVVVAVFIYVRMKQRRLGSRAAVMDDQTEPTFDKSKRNSNNLGLQPIGGQSMDPKYGGVDLQPENGYTDNVRDSTKTFENLNPNY